MEGLVGDKTNRNDRGTRHPGAFLKRLKEEKVAGQVGAGNPAAGQIIDAKKAPDEAIKNRPGRNRGCNKEEK
jgi:hypothetical protein